MWQKIKNNLLTIATSAYFMFWVYFISIFMSDFFDKERFSEGWNDIIYTTIILTPLSGLLIFALTKKKKNTLLRKNFYLLLFFIIFANIYFVIALANAHGYRYIMFASNDQIKYFFTRNFPNYSNSTIKNNSLQFAVLFKRDKEIVKFFIDKGADVNNVDDDGRTPLSYAVSRCSPKVVETLVKNGANINYQSKKLDQTTPLMNAIILNENINYKEKIVELLINAGADFNIQSSDGRRALDYATILYVKNKDEITLRTIELLLEAGANPYLKPSEDFLSPYETAQKYENKELIEFFDKYRPVE